MDTPRQEREIRQLFQISVGLKGLVSFFEIVGGLAVFFIPISTITDFVASFAQSELIENPGDFIAIHLLQAAQYFAFTSKAFIAFYLLSRGLIKLVLVVALLYNKLWAYPSSLVVLALFVVYQLYQISLSRSVFIILLTIFDLIVMYFIWREYQIVKEHLRTTL